MAEKFDKTPNERESQRKPDPSELASTVRNLSDAPPTPHGKPATKASEDLYELILDDHPLKLTEAQAGYRADGGDDQAACGGCVHYYVGKVAQRQVCEIVRPDNDENINPAGRCRFFTTDTENFPFLKNPAKNKTPEGE